MGEQQRLLYDHDKKIDKLEISIEQVANSIDQLANGISSSNRKMEGITGMLNTQNILMERFSNMDLSLKESFSRVCTRVGKLETAKEKHELDGCPAATSAHKRISRIDSALGWVNKLILLAVLGAVLSLVIIK